MKSRLLAGFIFVFFGGALVFAQSSAALITLNVPVETVQAGDTFTLTIQVDDANGVYGGSLKIVYDPQILQVQPGEAGAVTPGDFFNNQPGFTLKNTADPAAGTIDYALTLRQPAEPISGGGTLGSIQFLALSDGAARINVQGASLLAPVFETVDGRTVARQVNEIPVEVQGLAMDVGGSGIQSEPITALVQPTQSAVRDTVVQQPVSAAPMPSFTALAPSPAIIGVLFFLVGLLLFTLSIGTYVRLRRQMSWQDSL